MGSGPSSTTTQSGQTTTSPWAPAIPYLQNILNASGNASLGPSGYQNTALSNLLSQSFAVPQMGSYGDLLDKNLFNYNTNPQQGALNSALGTGTGILGSSYNNATGLTGSSLSGALGPNSPLMNSYATTINSLRPYLNQNYTNPQAVPGFNNTLQAIGQQTQQATDSLFGAAGRDPAGNAQAAKAAATATMNAEAPYLTNEYNSLVGQQQNAINQLYGAGSGASSLIGQLGLGGANLLGSLGIGNAGALSGLTSGLTGALTAQQGQQFNTGLEGVQLAEGLPGLWTTPGESMLAGANAATNAPIMNLPGIESLINPIAGLGGTSINFGTGTTQGSQSMMGNVLGGILGLGGLFGGGGLFPGALGGMFSDIRLKEDIEPIGKLSSGVPLYTFRYKGDPETRVGPMAQEVEKMYPEAVVTHPSGFKTVDYGAINNGILGGIL